MNGSETGRKIGVEPEGKSTLRYRRPIDHLLGTTDPIPPAVLDEIVRSGRNILDFGRYMGLPEPNGQDRSHKITQKRRVKIDDIVIPSITNGTIPTLHEPLTLTRINPDTVWEGNEKGNKPDLFFGMGGGSTSIIRAATFEALIMFLSAEALRRRLDLGKVRALLANRITFTNLPYSSDFLPRDKNLSDVQTLLQEQGPEGIEASSELQTKVNKRLGAERDIYTLLMKKMGFDMSRWDIFLQTDIAHVVDDAGLKRYESTIATHNDILRSLTGLDEYHYAQEDGVIDALVNGPLGGVKLGWLIRNLDEVHGGYIMDEQPFDARWIVGQALRKDTDGENKVTLAYALAAPRLYPDAYGNLRKASPYICYDPDDMITLHPDEDVIGKFQAATQAGGGIHFMYIRHYYSSIVDVFEELTGVHFESVNVDGQKVPLVQYVPGDKKTWETIPLRVKAMRDWLLRDNEDEIRTFWQAFEEDSPRVSTGLPMKLPASKYFEELGIQPEGLYYRIKNQSYGEDTFGALAKLYQSNSQRIDLTRDVLILASLVHEKIQAIHNERQRAIYGDTLSTKKINQIYKALAKIGSNTGIASLGYSQPEVLLIQGAEQSGLHINPEVANYIATLKGDTLTQIMERTEAFLTIVSYPNTTLMRKKARELGYDLQGMTDRELKVLQTIAEEFFEARLKGSTPRRKWIDIYNVPAAERSSTTTANEMETVVVSPEQEAEEKNQLINSVTVLKELRDRIAADYPRGARETDEILFNNIPVLKYVLDGYFRAGYLRGGLNLSERISSLPVYAVIDTHAKIDALLSTISAVPSVTMARRLIGHLPFSLPNTKAGHETLQTMAREYNLSQIVQPDSQIVNYTQMYESLERLDRAVVDRVSTDKDLLRGLYEDALEDVGIELQNAEEMRGSNVSHLRDIAVEKILRGLRSEVVHVDGLRYSRYQMLISELIERERLTEDSDEVIRGKQDAYERSRDVVLDAITRERVVTRLMVSLKDDPLLCQMIASRHNLSAEDFLNTDEDTKRKSITYSLLRGRRLALSTNPPRVFDGSKLLSDARKQLEEDLEDPSTLSELELKAISGIPKIPEKKTIFAIAHEYLRNQIASSLEGNIEILLDALAKNALDNKLSQMSKDAVDSAIKSLGITTELMLEDPTVLDQSTQTILELAIQDFRGNS